MKFTTSLIATVAALISAVSAQGNATAAGGNYTTGLITALGAANLTVLAGLLQAQPQLAAALQNGNYSVFAPTNAALTTFVGAGALPNASVIASILSYHITTAPIRQASLSANHTIVPSLLQEPLINGSAPLVVYQSTAGPVVLTASRDVSIGANATYQNLLIHQVNSVLLPPQNLTTTAGLTNLTLLAGFLGQLGPNVLPTLSNTPKITVFAPINSAFAALNTSALAALNTTQLTAIGLGHVINGTVVYSTNITATTTATAAAGQTLRFNTTGGVSVSSGNATARIVRPDIPISNGVLHLIDHVLA